MPLRCAQRRNVKRARLNGRRGVNMAQFSIGDYVLYTEVWKTKRDRLRARWRGTATVTGSSSNGILRCEILSLARNAKPTLVVSKFYVDKDLKIEGNVLAHVAQK